MKPYGFNEKEYTDLNSLGIDFAGNLDLALEAIQQKAFLKFVKNLKHLKNKSSKFYMKRDIYRMPSHLSSIPSQKSIF